MSKRLIAVLGLAIAVLVVVIFALRSGPSPDRRSGSDDGVDKARSAPSLAEPLTETDTFNVSKKHSSGVNLLPGIVETAEQLHAPDGEWSDDLEILNELLSSHEAVFGRMPGGGENRDIVANLTGQNSKKTAVISPDHPSLNEEGELVDRWGTPYHFHPIARDRMDVRSAGPDRALWTDDDVFLESGDEIAVGEANYLPEE